MRGRRAWPKVCTAASQMPQSAPIFLPSLILPPNNRGWLFLVAIQQDHANLPKYPAQITVTTLQPTIDYHDILLTSLALGRKR
jgi:hypothetical protein